jgi:hypothetical protein
LLGVPYLVAERCARDGIEVAVDDDVEHAVQQEAHPVGGEVGRAVPALEHGANREAVVLADGDEPALRDERVDLGLFEAAIFNVDAHGKGGQEEVRGVAIKLWALMRL